MALNSSKQANAADNDPLIEQILADNKDSDAATCRIQCQVARWDKHNKDKWWALLINPPDSMSQSEFSDIAEAFGGLLQADLLADYYIQSYFDNIPKVFTNKTHFFARIFLFSLFPGRYLHGRNFIDQLRNVINDNSHDKYLSKYGETVIDAYERRLAGQAQSSSEHWTF